MCRLPVLQSIAAVKLRITHLRSVQEALSTSVPGAVAAGGFAVSSYDAVVLTAAALKAAASGSRGRRIGDLRKTLRSLCIQGLGVPIVFPPGLNQPVGFPLDLLRLDPLSGNSSDPVIATTTVITRINQQNLYPKFKVGTTLP